MYIYVIMYGFLIVGALLYKRKPLKYAILVAIFYIAIIGLRSYTVGVDTLQYKNRFDNLLLLMNDSKLQRELGFTYFTYLFKEILKTDFRIYILAISVIVVLFTVAFFCKGSDSQYLSYMMYASLGMLAMNMSALRQSLAISIIMCAFLFIEKRKPIIFILIVIIAASIHNSAVVFLPIYFLFGKRIKREMAYLLFILSTLFYFFMPIVVPIIKKILPEGYQEIELMSGYKMNFLVFALPVIISFFCLFFMKTESDGKYSEKYSFYFFLSCIYIALYSLAFYNMNFGRLACYFYMGQSILLPNVVTAMKIRNNSIIINIVFSIVCILYFFISLPGGTLAIDNYNFL